MRHPEGFQKLVIAALIASSALVIITGLAWGIRFFTTRTQTVVVQPADNGIGGFPMSGNLAPDFSLIDQFGRPVTLSSLRGHEIVLAFIDSRCTSLCPLTANIMYTAKTRLGPTASNQVMLVAVNANPSATSIAEVQSWSINHGMLHQWLFLTGTATQLEAVYHAYQIEDQVGANGQLEHDAATIIIDAQGHERLYFDTLDSNNQSDLSSEEDGMEAGMKQWLPH